MKRKLIRGEGGFGRVDAPARTEAEVIQLPASEARSTQPRTRSARSGALSSLVVLAIVALLVAAVAVPLAMSRAGGAAAGAQESEQPSLVADPTDEVTAEPTDTPATSEPTQADPTDTAPALRPEPTDTDTAPPEPTDAPSAEPTPTATDQPTLTPTHKPTPRPLPTPAVVRGHFGDTLTLSGISIRVSKTDDTDSTVNGVRQLDPAPPPYTQLVAFVVMPTFHGVRAGCPNIVVNGNNPKHFSGLIWGYAAKVDYTHYLSGVSNRYVTYVSPGPYTVDIEVNGDGNGPWVDFSFK